MHRVCAIAWLSLAFLLPCSPHAGLAQARASTVISLGSQPTPLMAGWVTPWGRTLPCPDCHPPKRFWAAAGELMAAQAVPWAFTRYVRDGEWARISPTTWLDNLKFPWQWDNNRFNN